MAETINIKDLQLTTQIDPSDFLLVEKAEGTRKIAGTIFNSLKGPKGDRGDVGPAGPQGPAVAVVNDLTTGGTTKALSAEQGKAIKTLIDSLTQKLTALETKVNQNHPS